MYTKIAKATPFEGKPNINLPDIFGASPGKPIILRIPVTGKRPIVINASGLPEGLKLSSGIITGTVAAAGDYKIKVAAENELGCAEKEITLEIHKDKILLTPLLGFTSWNAFGAEVSQEKIISVAEKLISSGIAEYGYSYINTDSGWQEKYGGEFDAIMPNERFPDMEYMCGKLHSLGFKCGIYSTPMLTAWGCPKEFESIPGCTCGAPDELFADTNGGIGKIRKEKNNARQWEKWGFDYLKYDWDPCDPYNAEMMRKELASSSRDFGFCVTEAALPAYRQYWETYCNSYRCNPDSLGTWERLSAIYETYGGFVNSLNKGHFFDLDMLDVGTTGLEDTFRELTEDEQLVSYSIRAFLCSPVQISSTLENISDFELSVYCNEEIIAINQDIAFSPARPCYIKETGNTKIHIFKKRLYDGGSAYAFFNMGETKETATVYLEEESKVRDVWAKEDLGKALEISAFMQPHTVRIFKTMPCRSAR